MGYKMSNSKDTKPRRAVLVSIKREGDEFRVSLDDVEFQSLRPATWKQKDHVTSKLIAVKALEDLVFNEKELANLGYYILARLHAFKESGEI
jgi:hypothetical protein